MNMEQYSERAQGFLQSAQTHALGQSHQQFLPEHILKIMLDDREGFASGLIEQAGGDPKAAQLAVEMALGKLPKVSGGNDQLYMSQPIAKVFATSEEIAKKRAIVLLPLSACF